MKPLAILLFLCVAPAVLATSNDAVAPIGERVYVDTGNLWEPLKIVPKSSDVEGVLDPNLTPKAEKKGVKQTLPTVKKEKKTSPASQLVFKEINVKGRLGQPRVRFDRSRLEVGRVDARPDTTRFNRVFEVRRGEL